MIGFGGFLSIQRSDNNAAPSDTKISGAVAATRFSSACVPFCADAITSFSCIGKRKYHSPRGNTFCCATGPAAL
ncbi:hypothetical protein XOCgx_2577 [Xanthomonas oryzae pv. oryzicola]|nr:hypothetical protein XOCgx_2577 [Xanthomonas oryzae pv. oryzicola]